MNDRAMRDLFALRGAALAVLNRSASPERNASNLIALAKAVESCSWVDDAAQGIAERGEDAAE